MHVFVSEHTFSQKLIAPHTLNGLVIGWVRLDLACACIAGIITVVV